VNPPWVLLANPTAGSGKSRHAAQRASALLAAAGRPVELCFTQARGHALVLARQALARGCDRIIVCGGDGTLNEVLPALAGSTTELGILPCGTANDLARALSLPRRLQAAVRVQLSGFPQALDLGRCDDKYFATVAAFGFDADISLAMQNGQIPFKGTPGYLYATLKHLRRFRPFTVRLSGEFGSWQGEVLLVAAANTATYGGGLRIAPHASPCDGLLDVCIVRKIPPATLLCMLPRLFWGGHLRHPAVRLERTAWLRVETEGANRPLCADGERLSQTPTRLHSSAAALRVILPLETRSRLALA
jgi:diacylglycerol kinase (ATP)